jgi:SAM-dependent methyltransferase
MPKTAPFDDQTNEYDAWFEKHPDLFQAELETVRSFIPASGVGVEIGVGTGRFAALLGIHIGVEPAPRMAELARQRGIQVLEGAAEALPFFDSSYDFAVMVTVVCFLDDLSLAFREACRILRPNGTLVIGFIDRESELGRQYSQKMNQSRFYRDATFYSVSELEALLTKAGFSNFAYRQTVVPGEATDLTVRDGHGSGGFVVIRAQKKREGEQNEGWNHPLSVDRGHVPR